MYTHQSKINIPIRSVPEPSYIARLLALFVLATVGLILALTDAPHIWIGNQFGEMFGMISAQWSAWICFALVGLFMLVSFQPVGLPMRMAIVGIMSALVILPAMVDQQGTGPAPLVVAQAQ